MKFDLFDGSLSGYLSEDKLKKQILDTNHESREYGLVLNEQDVEKLVSANNDNLKVQERIELGESVITKLIQKFMLSRYISQSDYADTVSALLEVFYEAKEESADGLTDDEVLDSMFYFFENVSQGSVELLQTRDMDYLCRNIRNKTFSSMDEEDY